MKTCLKDVLLNRQYNVKEDCVSYICKPKNLCVKIDVSGATKDAVIDMDKKCIEAITVHCQYCK